MQRLHSAVSATGSVPGNSRWSFASCCARAPAHRPTGERDTPFIVAGLRTDRPRAGAARAFVEVRQERTHHRLRFPTRSTRGCWAEKGVYTSCWQMYTGCAVYLCRLGAQRVPCELNCEIGAARWRAELHPRNRCAMLYVYADMVAVLCLPR